MKPCQLVFVVEEAHKLLNREMASQTTFSTIAREMRKYYVTLLIVDQRPSQIYDEVLSQLGTRICGYLTDDEDIRAVLSGAAGKVPCAACWHTCSPKKRCSSQAGGVPMPIPVRSRRLDAGFWEELKKAGQAPCTVVTWKRKRNAGFLKTVIDHPHDECVKKCRAPHPRSLQRSVPQNFLQFLV